MKLGLGLYRHMLNDDYYSFAAQAGCTHVIAHLVDYFRQGESNPAQNQPTGAKDKPWGVAGDPNRLWTAAELTDLRKQVEAAGLKLEAIENLDPAHWHDILLDGPRRTEHIQNVKQTLRAMGEAGIGTLGYNFSLAGVCGRVTGPFARGGALSVGMNGLVDTPIPNGVVWNMIVDPNAPAGFLPTITHDELWRRLERFLEEVLPVAEKAGVRLAAHPDDPPTPTMRQQPRLVYQQAMYQRLIDISPSPSNMLEFCLGTLAEMTEGNLYETVAQYSAQKRLAYVHFRNVHGKAPHYHETFIDDGDVDMLRIVAILHQTGFDGVLIPDHTPQMNCSAAWHAGMAHTLGFLRAAIDAAERGFNA
ncbi:MAG: mannonate dehydratase [Terracidiphilus sp.]|nr:mannonate dehydratase [Terracidiphilus sp.]